MLLSSVHKNSVEE